LTTVKRDERIGDIALVWIRLPTAHGALAPSPNSERDRDCE
jgi:hypothetical protein